LKTSVPQSGCAVEAREREGVAREVGGNPVEDHPDSVLVHTVDEVTQVVR